MGIFFISDLHLGHKAAIRMCERPFETVEEMNETLISNWNRVVNEGDTVYMLGDVSHRLTVESANELIKQLHGKKVLIKGNHDKQYDATLFEGIYDFLEIHVYGVSISLMHYPMLEWPKFRYGSVHLHGHSHNKADYNLQMKSEGIHRYDVGVDANNFTPVSIKHILEFMEIDSEGKEIK